MLKKLKKCDFLIREKNQMVANGTSNVSSRSLSLGQQISFATAPIAKKDGGTPTLMASG
jgi:hypothetical protein